MRKIYTLFIFFNACIINVTAQNYAIGEKAINFVDQARSGRQVPAEIYYPANGNGTNVPLAAGVDKFPVVVFGHGFVIPVSAYEWLADSLVKKGYIVAFPSTEGSLSPSHAAFGDDLLFLCNRLTSLNDSAESFLYQRVIKKAALSGHSMGGGSSFLAATGNSNVVSAIFNFAAAETNPSAIAAAASVNKPALIFSGSGDCIVPASTQFQMFTNIIASCKTYINITGALHCQFANNNGTCTLGQLVSGCNSSAITPAEVFNKTTALVIPFLDFYLKDSCTRGDDYLKAYDALTGVEKNRTCNSFPECGILAVNLETFNGHLVDRVVSLQWVTTSEDNTGYFIVEKSADGTDFHLLKQVNATGATGLRTAYASADNSPYPGYSYYRLKIINRDGHVSTSSVIKIATEEKGLALISLFPNPVKNNIQVELFSNKLQKVTLNISDAIGQTLVHESVSLNKGLNKKEIVLTKLVAGIYTLSCKDEQGIVRGSIKIIKE